MPTTSPGSDSCKTSTMGGDEDKSMATFASVAAMSHKELTPSPTKAMENTSSENDALVTAKHCSITDVDERPTAQTHADNIFESFEPNRLLEDGQTVDIVETNESGSHDVNESADMSCDSCTQLQASNKLDESCDSPASPSSNSVVGKLSKKLLTKSFKHLKRKLKKGKSKKLTRLKKSKCSKLSKRTEEPSESGGQVLDLESSVRSVCSESEPLPTYGKHESCSDTDSDWEEGAAKRRKIRPPTPCRYVTVEIKLIVLVINVMSCRDRGTFP